MTSGNVTGLRILLVDDHAATVDILVRLLKLFEHKVQVAGSVEQAVLAADSDFDLLISDYSLPDGDGIALLQQLRPTAPMRAILLTGNSCPEDLQAAAAAGYDMHVIKPVDIDVLQKAINRLFQTAN